MYQRKQMVETHNNFSSSSNESSDEDVVKTFNNHITSDKPFERI